MQGTSLASCGGRLLFYRDFQEYTGGHQKVADYFAHLQSSSNFKPVIAFSSNSLWNQSNPWFPEYQHQLVDYRPANYEYVFLAGMDWEMYLASARPENQPVINLIQHVRHADPAQPMHRFLSQRAIRICVSPEVEKAITGTGKVNGPVFTIANGIDIPAIEPRQKRHDVFIFGPKNPHMAEELKTRLAQQDIGSFCVTEWLPREQLLVLLASSRIAVMLPNPTEGFYLPALEAMRYADITIVPDCVGNRSFCHNQQNCLIPEYNSAALAGAVNEALVLHQQHDRLNIFKQHCAATLAYHSLQRERTEFLALMNQVDELWASGFSCSV
ncbi:glycosyltransferase [Cellvibrio sp. OA-2007]|uniref:glycosyltransferase n=1 Tax=Cellvibrio sp. OA-2007 TaxID=529823 RepID=UPI000785A9CF|nr:glycosyltransferase [Cellvibrio sp. OA-2007]